MIKRWWVVSGVQWCKYFDMTDLGKIKFFLGVKVIQLSDGDFETI